MNEQDKLQGELGPPQIPPTSLFRVTRLAPPSMQVLETFDIHAHKVETSGAAVRFIEWAIHPVTGVVDMRMVKALSSYVEYEEVWPEPSLIEIPDGVVIQ